jgi:hypothetical protein
VQLKIVGQLCTEFSSSELPQEIIEGSTDDANGVDTNGKITVKIEGALHKGYRRKRSSYSDCNKTTRVSETKKKGQLSSLVKYVRITLRDISSSFSHSSFSYLTGLARRSIAPREESGTQFKPHMTSQTRSGPSPSTITRKTCSTLCTVRQMKRRQRKNLLEFVSLPEYSTPML